MAEPDDLYTLRAQFWLGHYDMVRSDDGVPLVSGSEVDKGAKTRVAFWSRFYHIMCSFLFLSEASERDAEGMFGFDLLGAQCHAAEIGFPPLEESSVCNNITGGGGGGGGFIF